MSCYLDLKLTQHINQVQDATMFNETISIYESKYNISIESDSNSQAVSASSEDDDIKHVSFMNIISIMNLNII